MSQSTTTEPEYPGWIARRADGVVVKLYIQPKASCSEISGEHGEGDSVRLKVRVAAPPVDGEANEELIRFLRKLTKLPTSRVHIIRGATSRSKDVLFQGASLEDIFKLTSKTLSR